MSEARRPDERERELRARAEARTGGLCPRCAHVHLLENDRGSIFLRCRAADVDARLVRYPPQPVLSCPAWSG